MLSGVLFIPKLFRSDSMHCAIDNEIPSEIVREFTQLKHSKPKYKNIHRFFFVVVFRCQRRMRGHLQQNFIILSEL